MSGGAPLDRTALALLAHELRGALTVISGYAELIAREDFSAAERARAVTGIQAALVRADALIEAALAGDGPTAARSRDRIMIEDIVLAVVADASSLSGRKIRPRVESSPVVVGDGQALGRAIANLVENALKYADAPSPIDVEVRARDGRALVEVCDRGPGVPEAERDRLLTPFSRLERDRDRPGTGLGLALVGDIARAHGGSFELLDRPGGGTIARLSLPLG